MGLSRLSGPAYGAKATLLGVGPFSASTGSSAIFSGAVVPSGEDWYATELVCFRNSTGTNGFVVSLHKNSSLIGSVTLASTAVAGAVGIITKDGGEYEGARLASGSTITLSHSSHAGANANVTVTLRGFTRFVNSTRSE
jgi:hypothetical protein